MCQCSLWLNQIWESDTESNLETCWLPWVECDNLGLGKTFRSWWKWPFNPNPEPGNKHMPVTQTWRFSFHAAEMQVFLEVHCKRLCQHASALVSGSCECLPPLDTTGRQGESLNKECSGVKVGSEAVWLSVQAPNTCVSVRYKQD